MTFNLKITLPISEEPLGNTAPVFIDDLPPYIYSQAGKQFPLPSFEDAELDEIYLFLEHEYF